MKIIKFNQLIIKDFKGIADLTIDFTDITKIQGDNGTGKTSIVDAITWLLHGKDSIGRTKFQVLPLDKDNKEIPGTTPTVILKMTIDGNEKTLKKELGKDTKCLIDGIPYKVTDYATKVNEIIDEEMFKVLLIPTYFASYEWKKQRDIMMKNIQLDPAVIDAIDKKYPEIAKEKALLEVEVNYLSDKYNEQLKSSKKEKEQLQGKIAYLDETVKNHVEVESLPSLISEKLRIEQSLDSVLANAETHKNADNELSDIETKVKLLESEKELKTRQFESNKTIGLNKINAEINAKTISKTNALAEYKRLTIQISTKCTLCGQDLQADKIELAKTEQQRLVDENKVGGKKLAEEITVLQSKLEELSRSELDLSGIDKEIETLKAEYKDKAKNIVQVKIDTDIPTLRARLDEINKLLASSEQAMKQKAELETFIDKITKVQESINTAETRIDEIKDINMMTAEETANQLNKNFKTIQIKVFDIQKNREIKETFEILRNGVPYSVLNTAGKVQAGIELINYLQEVLGVKLPLVVDNKETVNELGEIDTQVITLTVTKDKILKVEGDK